MIEYTVEQIESMKYDIDQMGQEEIARLWRYAPAGHPFFRGDLPLFAHMKARFDSLGGMMSSISKVIG